MEEKVSFWTVGSSQISRINLRHRVQGEGSVLALYPAVQKCRDTHLFPFLSVPYPWRHAMSQ